ncbi:unnamed protein product, partial [Oppiella nova]
MTALISLQANSKAAKCLYLMVALIGILLSQYSGSLSPVIDSSRQLWLLVIESRFAQAFIASLFVIIFSELGDKTFFISAIMAMKHSRSSVF